jgi:uncharacterized protein
MSSSPAHLVQTLLANPLDLKNVQSVTAELRRLLPWAGGNKGPESIVKASEGIGRTWETKAFEVRDVIEQADKVALFGSFTYRGGESSKEITSPFSLLAHVKGRKLIYVQFLEDSFGTSRTVSAAT